MLRQLLFWSLNNLKFIMYKLIKRMMYNNFDNKPDCLQLATDGS